MAIVSPPTVTATLIDSTSVSVTVNGDSAQYYEVFVERQPIPGARTSFGSILGGTTLTGSGLSPQGSYLVFAQARNGPTGDYQSQPGFTTISLASVDSVLAAFQAGLAASPATQAALSGGLWANEVPEDRDLPYGFIELLDSRFMWTTEDFHVEVAKVRLHIYTIGGQACESLTRQVRQIYDWGVLPFSASGASSTVQVMPTDYCVQSEFARLNTGELVYQGTVEYEVMVNRNVLRG